MREGYYKSCVSIEKTFFDEVGFDKWEESIEKRFYGWRAFFTYVVLSKDCRVSIKFYDKIADGSIGKVLDISIKGSYM